MSQMIDTLTAGMARWSEAGIKAENNTVIFGPIFNLSRSYPLKEGTPLGATGGPPEALVRVGHIPPAPPPAWPNIVFFSV